MKHVPSAHLRKHGERVLDQNNLKSSFKKYLQRSKCSGTVIFDSEICPANMLQLLFLYLLT